MSTFYTEKKGSFVSRNCTYFWSKISRLNNYMLGVQDVSWYTK